MSDCCKPKGELNTPHVDEHEASSQQSCCNNESKAVSKALFTNASSGQDDGRKSSGVAESCSTPVVKKNEQNSCCDTDSSSAKKTDYLLWVSLLTCLLFYAAYLILPASAPESVHHFSHSIFEMINTMWWGVLLGLVFVGLLANVPQNFVLSVLGKGGTFGGLLRATGAGVLLDLCSHGILMVGMKLYQKGASLGQVMAFLIASPWNSFSLTFVMLALIGLKWTLCFILLSIVIALISGWIFDVCVSKKILPANPNTVPLQNNFRFWPEAARQWKSINWSFSILGKVVRDGLSGSRMVLRWLLFGIVLAALIKTFISAENFQQWFGPTLIGMVLTLIAATVIEVCSEGSTPIAADLLTRAAAPGNSFTFLMAGVSTDYTEIMVLKDTSGNVYSSFLYEILTSISFYFLFI
ncbi:MAG: ATPase, partial [Moraxellaceae bacterium]